MKASSKLIFIIPILIFTVYSCGTGSGNSDYGDGGFRKGKGDRYYGGVMKINELEYYSIYPPSIIYSVPTQIAGQVFETLVKFDQKTLQIIPGLAESWEVDTSGMNYTFHLRKGVRFHDNKCFPDGKGREFVADDVKQCFEHLCKEIEFTAGYNYVFKNLVEGADEFRAKSLEGVEDIDVTGIEIIDKYTLRIKLVKASSGFLYTLAMPYNLIFPHEGYVEYGEEVTVGTGAFQVASLKVDDHIKLARNDHYYLMDSLGNQLPFLDSIHISFNNDKDEEVELFKSGDIDLIADLSTGNIIDILEVPFTQDVTAVREYQQQRTPLLSTLTYEFLTSKGVFSNVDLRKAISYAVDRQLILDKVLDGEADGPGHNGFCPPVFSNYGYDAPSVKGYEFDLDLAKQHLKKAGYSDGSDLGTITLDIGTIGGRNALIATEIKTQLKKHLNIEIEINLISKKERIDKTKKGESSFYNREWTSDYPGPSSFLALLYGRDVPDNENKFSYPNTARWKNENYDTHFQNGVNSRTIEQSYTHFLEAEKILMEEAVILVLAYQEGYRLLQPYIRNFPANAQKVRNFSEVWFDAEVYNRLVSHTQPEEGDNVQ